MLDHYCLEVYSKQSQKIEFQNGRLFLWSLAWYVLPLKRKNAAPLLRPTWRKQNEGCLQGVQIGVGTSQNVALQNGPDSEVHRIDIWIWWWPHLLVPEAWEMVLARLLSHIRCVSWSPVHCEDEIIPKWFSESRQNLFLQHIQINLTIDFHAFLNQDQRRFVPIGCNNSPDHDWSRLLAFQMASGVDWQVLWTFGMNPIILLIVTSSTVKIFSSDQMKTFPAARSISCNINLPLCNRFWFKGSEINCRDYFLYGLNWRSFLTILCIEDFEIFASFAIFSHFSVDFAPSSFSLKKQHFGAKWERSAWNWFTRGCACLLKLFPGIENCSSTHLDLFNDALVANAHSLESGNLVALNLISHNLPNTRKKWMNHQVNIDRYIEV